jgi:DNA polymerase-3 subunit gamma/tau
MGQALYRKWRPQTFDDVVGQEHIVRTLRNALRTEHIHHAYLLSGPRGIGKTTTARLIAKAVNCLSPSEQRPCGTCEMCLAIRDGRFMDLVEIDGASQTGVDNIRDLIEKVNFRPAQGRYKVYVIDEVHMLSVNSFNALLKTLEEPPEYVIFILATTEVHKILPTVLSRLQRFEFRRIPLDIIVKQLQKIVDAENITVEPEALSIIARSATGSMRDAITLLDQLSASGDVTADTVRLMLGAERREVVRSLLQTWLDEDLKTGFSIINTAVDSGADPRQLARQTTDFLRGLLLIRLGAGQTWADPTEEERPIFEDMARKATVDNLVKAVEHFSAAAQKQRTGWQPQLALELALIQALQPITQPVQSVPVKTAIPPKSNQVRTPAVRISERSKPKRPPGHNRKTPANDVRSQKITEEKVNIDQSQDSDEADMSSMPEIPKDDQTIVTQIQDNWQSVIKKMRNKSLGALLRDAVVAGIDEQGKLVLSFQHSFHRKRVDELENCQELETALSKNFNYKFSVRCLMNGEWHAPQQAVPDANEGKENDQSIESSPSSESIEPDELIRRAQEELGAVAKIDGV